MDFISTNFANQMFLTNSEYNMKYYRNRALVSGINNNKIDSSPGFAVSEAKVNADILKYGFGFHEKI